MIRRVLMKFLKISSKNSGSIGQRRTLFDREKLKWEIKKKQIALEKKRIEVLRSRNMEPIREKRI